MTDDLDIIQLNSDGSADTSFGTDGEEEQTSLPTADGIALAGNGDLLVGGVSSLSFVVTELNSSSGALDTSYNTSGSASVAVATSGSLTYIGMAVAPDGDVMLAGGYKPASSSNRYATFVAITPSGSIDSTFGTSGVDIESTSIYYTAHPGFSPFAINSDGQLFLGDTSETGVSSNTTFTVYEYNRNGSVDSSFGTSGAATETVSGERTGVILQMLTNGQIVIGAAGGNLILVRFNADGSLDTTFGTSGVETGASADGGFSMTTAANGETVLIGTPTSGSGIILQEFHTLANKQRLYVEQDADYNVTSLTDINGNVVERYEYDPYGNVTVLSPNGTVRGDGLLHSSFYAWNYTFQGGRDDIITGQLEFEHRDDNIPLGRWDEEDFIGYGDTANRYLLERDDSPSAIDYSGLITEILAGYFSAMEDSAAVEAEQPLTEATTPPIASSQPPHFPSPVPPNVTPVAILTAPKTTIELDHSYVALNPGDEKNISATVKTDGKDNSKPTIKVKKPDERVDVKIVKIKNGLSQITVTSTGQGLDHGRGDIYLEFVLDGDESVSVKLKVSIR